jgi:putative tryptophan/tyrosine transport system substrate-binding protein
MLRDLQFAASRLGIELRTIVVRGPDEFEPAFMRVAEARAGALMILSDPTYTPYLAQLTGFANRSRLPAMYSIREYAMAGGLMSYGANFTTLFQRAADYVDKILKGAKPADLPVEQPTKFDLLINLKTAKAFGIMLPPTLLARADEVIE